MPTKTLNIALDEELLKSIDEAVKQDMGSRSEYFRRLNTIAGLFPDCS